MIDDKKILQFIQKERSAVLSILVGKFKVHSAAMLYSFQTKPLSFYFFTENDSKKMELLLRKNECNAALVIGTTEELKKTLQVNGDIKIVSNEKHKNKVKEIHYERFPESMPYESEKVVFLEFIPTWWRFTNYSTRPPKIKESRKKK